MLCEWMVHPVLLLKCHQARMRDAEGPVLFFLFKQNHIHRGSLPPQRKCSHESSFCSVARSPGHLNPTCGFGTLDGPTSLSSSGRPGRFQREQLLRSAAAARDAINCMSRHDAGRLLTSWPPRNRNGDEPVGPLGDTADVQHVVKRLCAVCPQATTAPLSPRPCLQPDFFFSV